MAMEIKKINRVAILKEWEQVSREYCEGDLTEEEKMQFEQALFAAEQAKKTSFILGKPIKHCL
ncbi:hypothetical protein HY745_05870 [Candidatus Desantisbacteria bacterium]|nr:hypothetical protein [Candidatus Desantisbacteria bacterium]